MLNAVPNPLDGLAPAAADHEYELFPPLAENTACTPVATAWKDGEQDTAKDWLFGGSVSNDGGKSSAANERLIANRKNKINTARSASELILIFVTIQLI